MAALKRVLGSISAIWNKAENIDPSGLLASETKVHQGKSSETGNSDVFFDLGEDSNFEDRRETGEDEFSVDYDLEEFIIKTSARQQGHQDFNFAQIKSANNEYLYLANPVALDLTDNIYSCIDKHQLLFIDSKRICLANTLQQTVEQMFLKREVEKISILSHTVAVRRHKVQSKCPADLMLLDLRRFQNLVPYLQLFYTNLL